MTRLYYEIIKDIPVSLPSLDRYLSERTGCDLLGLAARTASVPRAQVIEKIKECRASVVPVSAGQGVIPGFTEGVQAVLQYIGIKCVITEQSDIAGIGEAFSAKSNLLFAADDSKFLAINLKDMTVTENSRATAAVFVHALAAAAERSGHDLNGQEVLVLGLGPVGSYAVLELLKLGSRVTVFDTDTVKIRMFTGMYPGVREVNQVGEAMQTINFVVDATPASNIIDESMLYPGTLISCPGVPHGLTAEALAKIGNNFIHDNLSLGVAAMAVKSLFKSEN